MTRTILPMKGLGTPRLLLWCRGFLHGKLLRTGGADPRGVITSTYVSDPDFTQRMSGSADALIRPDVSLFPVPLDRVS